jgi:hypothetical protein
MNLTQRAAAGLLMLVVAVPASAGDLRGSLARAVNEQSQIATPQRPGMAPAIRWSGLGLFVGGVGIATYGYLHTSDGEFVEPGDIGRVSSPKLAASGLVVAAAGGALLFWGNRRVKHAPSIALGPGRAEVTKAISW